MTSVSNLLASSFGTKLMRSTCWLAAPTYMMRRSLTVCAGMPSALGSVRVAEMSGKWSSPWWALHRGQQDCFAVLLNVEMSTKAVECGFDWLKQLRENGVWARCCPHLGLGGLELKMD